ncbi:Pex protein [Candidatus Synechococcus spongiarum]|uniref:Pex protein n=2 Tax=Candidatus Synechococcus spongiarum TaxID=431041 RepID=A0A1T1CYU9_9SYNE|nr:Pex protein [Candidatus Synechococcus spongiarum]OOV33782.1 Pex protein [Candidatus Synechococcus spongiarum LMB bulk15M]OOV35724.1 Pex protein [Candidatus Synechococcus spongiarum LMB bulk15N]
MASRRQLATMGLLDIQRFFAEPPVQYLGLELSVCWILECLLRKDDYPTAMTNQLAVSHPHLRISETMLQQAIEFLDRQGAVTSYSRRCPSRGRPRRMMHLVEAVHPEARSLVASWKSWLKDNRLNSLSGAGPVAGSSLTTEDRRLADELKVERRRLRPAATSA